MLNLQKFIAMIPNSLIVFLAMGIMFAATQDSISRTNVDVDGGMEVYRSQAASINIRSNSDLKRSIERNCRYEEESLIVNATGSNCKTERLGYFFVSQEFNPDSFTWQPEEGDELTYADSKDGNSERIQMFVVNQKEGQDDS